MVFPVPVLHPGMIDDVVECNVVNKAVVLKGGDEDEVGLLVRMLWGAAGQQQSVSKMQQ